MEMFVPSFISVLPSRTARSQTWARSVTSLRNREVKWKEIWFVVMLVSPRALGGCLIRSLQVGSETTWSTTPELSSQSVRTNGLRLRCEEAKAEDRRGFEHLSASRLNSPKGQWKCFRTQFFNLMTTWLNTGVDYFSNELINNLYNSEFKWQMIIRLINKCMSCNN